jgi:hypothetical protein
MFALLLPFLPKLEKYLLVLGASAIAIWGWGLHERHEGAAAQRLEDAKAAAVIEQRVTAAEKKADDISTKYQKATEDARIELETAQKTIIAQAYASGARCPAAVAPRVRESTMRQSIVPAAVPVAASQPTVARADAPAGDHSGLSAGAITEETAVCAALRSEVIAWRAWYPQQRDAWNDLVLSMAKK